MLLLAMVKGMTRVELEAVVVAVEALEEVVVEAAPKEAA